VKKGREKEQGEERELLCLACACVLFRGMKDETGGKEGTL
jgi:hypothetical protein